MDFGVRADRNTSLYAWHAGVWFMVFVSISVIFLNKKETIFEHNNGNRSENHYIKNGDQYGPFYSANQQQINIIHLGKSHIIGANKPSMNKPSQGEMLLLYKMPESC